ncbi:MAG TPA: hypothetical protein IGR64_01900 [Leptolyngbyaceae cyanobacterium M65_K2018_010]|nr:hypothetical protein [Leptolyngbyaceae cyanobacterium M65_K2018_010]
MTLSTTKQNPAAVKPYRWTVDRYHRAVQAGVFDGQPLELTDLLWLEGVLSGFLGYLPQFLESGFGDEDPEDLVLPVQTIAGQAKMRLRMPELEDLF